jgi:hypothetical protein
MVCYHYWNMWLISLIRVAEIVQDRYIKVLSLDNVQCKVYYVWLSIQENYINLPGLRPNHQLLYQSIKHDLDT